MTGLWGFLPLLLPLLPFPSAPSPCITPLSLLPAPPEYWDVVAEGDAEAVRRRLSSGGQEHPLSLDVPVPAYIPEFHYCPPPLYSEVSRAWAWVLGGSGHTPLSPHLAA